jgi:hypothetical protein
LLLSNKYIFWGLWLFFVTILTGINNYYFYEFVEDTSNKNAAQLKNTIFSQSCLNDEKIDLACKNSILNLIKAHSGKSFYNHSLTVSEANGTILWQHLYDRKAVTGSDIKINFDFSEKNLNILYSTFFDTPEFLMSVFRSMTFSISDLIPIIYDKGIKSATYDFKKRKMFHRTRPTIGFALFSFLILWLYKRREVQLEIAQKNKERLMIDEFKNEIEKINNHLNETELYDKFIKFDHILNPPINTINFKDLVSIDTNGIGNKFRKVLEKIFFPIVLVNLKIEPRDLKEAIHLLYHNKTISSKTQIYATLIRLYGNMDSHYNENSNITKEEINVLAFRLISIIEEVLESNLLIPTSPYIKDEL